VPQPDDVLLGRLAVKRGFATQEQVREGLAAARRRHPGAEPEDLASLLARQGVISSSDQKVLVRDLALARFVRGERIFARLCVERGLVAEEEARSILEEQREGGFQTRLGDRLVAAGRLDEATRDAIAAEQVRLEEAEAGRRRAGNGDGSTPAGSDTPIPESLSISAEALARFEEDQRRFSSSSGEAVPDPDAVEGFLLRERLARLALGVRYRAEPEGGGEAVLLTVLDPELSDDAPFLDAFRRAWAPALRVDHPHVAKLGALGATGRTIYYTQGDPGGDPLRAVVARGGPQPSLLVRGIARGLGKGLLAASKAGVAHGGLNPDNVLVTRAGAALADLGVAALPAARVEAFSSPQVIAGAAPTGSDDLYSLGCVLYYALVGREPFAPGPARSAPAPDPRQVDPSIDERLAEAVVLTTHPDPASRLPDLPALARVLNPHSSRTASGTARFDSSSARFDASVLRPGEVTVELPGGSGPPPPAPPPPAGPPGAPQPPSPPRPPQAPGSADADEAELPSPFVSSEFPDTIYVPAPRPDEAGAEAGGEEIERTMEVAAPPGLGGQAPGVTLAEEPLEFAEVTPTDGAEPEGEETLVAPGAGDPSVEPAGDAVDPNAVTVHDEDEQAGGSSSGLVLDGSGPTRSRPPAGEDLIGQTINNRYRITELIGQGGMGSVYEAEHTLMDRTVALKFLNPDLVDSDESVGRFKREIVSMAQFQHPNVVRIFDAGVTESGRFYMVMEYVAGESLAQLLEERGPLDPEAFGSIMAQILLGVEEGHARRIVHRDLKTDNLLLTSERGRDGVVKIMDFGIAKMLGGEEKPDAPQSASNLFLTTERVALGTPEYMSPEQASGAARVDRRSDIYSLGVVAYELLTGRLPFEADSPVGFIGKHIVDPPRAFAETAPELQIPAQLEQFVMKALEKEPTDRYQTADEMLLALEAILPSASRLAHEAEISATWPDPDEADPRSTPHPQPLRLGSSESFSADASDLDGVDASKSESGELAEELRGGRQRLIVKALVGSVAAAALLVVAILLALLTRSEPLADQLDATRPEVAAAVAAGEFSRARDLLEELRAGADEEEVAALLEPELERVGEAESVWAAYADSRRQLEDAVGAFRTAMERKAFDDAAERLEVARELAPKVAAGHAELVDLGLTELAGESLEAADPEALGAELVDRRVGALVERAERLGRAADHYGAIEALKAALEITPESRRTELERLLDQAWHDRLVAEARSELEKPRPDYVVAQERLEHALRKVNDPSTRGLLERVKRELHDTKERQLEDQVEELLRRKAQAVARRDFDAAALALEEARRALQQSRLPDSWNLQLHADEVAAARTSYEAFEALPPMRSATAAGSIERSIAARERYLEAHPEGLDRPEVEEQLATLRERLADVAASTRREAVRLQVRNAEAALREGDLERARAAARAAATAAREAGLDDLAGQAQAVVDEADGHRAEGHLSERLQADYARVGPILVARREVTNADYLAFCYAQQKAAAGGDAAAVAAARAHWPDHWLDYAPASNPQMLKRFPLGEGDHAVGGVSYRSGYAYCRWLGERLGLRVRLPSEAEWVAAATGGADRAYPWGDAWDDARVAHDLEAPVPVAAEDGSPADLRRLIEGGSTDSGLSHMAGNVAEWTSTRWGDDPAVRVVKGGSFRSVNPSELTVRARRRGPVDARRPEWGLRVVIDEREPEDGGGEGEQ